MSVTALAADTFCNLHRPLTETAATTEQRFTQNVKYFKELIRNFKRHYFQLCKSDSQRFGRIPSHTHTHTTHTVSYFHCGSHIYTVVIVLHSHAVIDRFHRHNQKYQSDTCFSTRNFHDSRIKNFQPISSTG